MIAYWNNMPPWISCIVRFQTSNCCNNFCITTIYHSPSTSPSPTLIIKLSPSPPKTIFYSSCWLLHKSYRIFHFYEGRGVWRFFKKSQKFSHVYLIQVELDDLPSVLFHFHLQKYKIENNKKLYLFQRFFYLIRRKFRADSRAETLFARNWT